MGESVFEKPQYLILSALMPTVVYFRTVEERLDEMYRVCGRQWVGWGGAIDNFLIY